MTTTTIHTRATNVCAAGRAGLGGSSCLRSRHGANYACPWCRASAAFTLVEILIGILLGTAVMAGVMNSFLMLGRSAANVANYSVAETQVRRAIEDFSQDVRMAKAITWNSPTSITLTVPDNYASTGNRVTYAYDASGSGPAGRCFYRVPGDASSTAPRTVFVEAIASCTFNRYNRQNNAATTDAETKRIRLTMNVRRTGSTLVAATTTFVSASFTLRNKIIN